MTPLIRVVGQAISLPEPDVDTDVIYPARFLLITEKRGLGRYAFHDRRDIPGFPIQDGAARPILIAGRNFGCGSSREHAPWALADYGFRVIIAPSFGEIFYSNCFRSGILPIRLREAEIAPFHQTGADGGAIRVDLERCEVEAGQEGPIMFEISPDRRQALLNGWNDTVRIQALHLRDIECFEEKQRRAAPWLWTNG